MHVRRTKLFLGSWSFVSERNFGSSRNEKFGYTNEMGCVHSTQPQDPKRPELLISRGKHNYINRKRSIGITQRIIDHYNN